jgi:hypothetical protein
MHLSIEEQLVVNSLGLLPWLIKAVYGFISDSMPIFGYRRKAYLIIGVMIAVLAMSAVADPR